ncbi:MAG: OsmC family protein, partial [Pseudomonadota bacterium]
MSITVKRDAGRAGMRHSVQIRNHTFGVDGSVPEGGEDAGPQPHDLYDAALGACKALTLLVYAKRKGIPVDDIEVTIARDDSGERQGVYKLKAALRVSGDLSDALESWLTYRATAESTLTTPSEPRSKVIDVAMFEEFL